MNSVKSSGSSKAHSSEGIPKAGAKAAVAKGYGAGAGAKVLLEEAERAVKKGYGSAAAAASVSAPKTLAPSLKPQVRLTCTF